MFGVSMFSQETVPRGLELAKSTLVCNALSLPLDHRGRQLCSIHTRSFFSLFMCCFFLGHGTAWPRSNVVFHGTYAKFDQSPDYRQERLDENNMPLNEVSPYDLVRGISLPTDGPMAVHPTAWSGRNLLGGMTLIYGDSLPLATAIHAQG